MNLTPEAREAKNEYARRWRERNREKAIQHQERYWQRVAEKTASANKE
jgi:hypothetical protein